MLTQKELMKLADKYEALHKKNFNNYQECGEQKYLRASERYEDMPVLCEKYRLFPEKEDWKGRIILLETSEEKPTPEKYRESLEYLKARGVFDAVSGVLAGKPMDETYAAEYKELLKEVIAKPELPIVFNINIGHAMPRCIMPFGVEATVDTGKQVIRFME